MSYGVRFSTAQGRIEHTGTGERGCPECDGERRGRGRFLAASRKHEEKLRAANPQNTKAGAGACNAWCGSAWHRIRSSSPGTSHGDGRLPKMRRRTTRPRESSSRKPQARREAPRHEPAGKEGRRGHVPWVVWSYAVRFRARNDHRASSIAGGGACPAPLIQLGLGCSYFSKIATIITKRIYMYQSGNV